MAKDTIEVLAIKPFALGGSEHMPGKVKVPAKSVANLVEKGFIEAPEQPAEEASNPLATQAEVEETVASYLSSTFGIQRSSDEGAAEFVARVAQGYHASQRVETGSDGNELDSVLSGIDKRAVSALKASGFDSLQKIVEANDEALVTVAYVTRENLPKIRSAIQAHSDAALASLQGSAS